MDKQNHNADEIPVIYIDDAFEFISGGNKTLLNIVINGKDLTKKYKILRTKNGGYIMQ